ncbi:hypothetical protein PVAR5_7826 [Paecilomyces variotii No. 5]|uniref:DASH complex subunit DUO1 n=1 Tax=Byssochlamys spectabilis (strain No. 5 / NBRC 109023) TaxID=1356009 RepID=V5I586_BYSSN|nr:hypothetical protein PVAR5_7826 [Paecilomyces variotii No. 5]
MAALSAAEEMDKLQLSEEDTEDLWNSPSKRRAKTPRQKTPKNEDGSPDPAQPRNGETLFDLEETREAALRNELQSVRNINQVIEGLLESLDRAKGNMTTVSRTVNSASTLLNTWTRILSQTEHNQRLILNPNWQGASQDIADMEQEAALKQQEAEKRERELQQRREAAARKAEEEERRRAAGTSTTRTTRGTTRGRDPARLEEQQEAPLWLRESQALEAFHAGLVCRGAAVECEEARKQSGDWPDLLQHQLSCALLFNGKMNFAPYQDESPEIERAMSPALADRAKSPGLRSPRASPPALNYPGGALPSPNQFAGVGGGHVNGGYERVVENGRLSLGAFETSLPIRLDYEAMLAYLLLPPAGGVFLLLFEHKSDYVRFHAWQSSLLFTAIFLLHLIFSWSSFISWLMFIGDIVLIGFLAMHAYRDVDSLEHYEVPFFGRFANSFVDDE